MRWIIAIGVLAGCHGGGSSHEREVKLDELPAIASFMGGLPLSGGKVTIDLSDDLDKITDWTKVTGAIDLDCGGCVLGDDHASIGGLVVGHVSWDDATAHATFANGDLTIVSHWRGDLDMDFTMHGALAPRLADMNIDGCLAYQPADRLRARDENLYNAALLTGAPRAPDGRYTITLRGTLGAMKRLPLVCDAPTQ